MADTAVTGANVVNYVKNTAVATPAGQSVTTGNTAVLTPASGKPFKGRYVVVSMVPTANSVVTFKAGVVGGTPANLARNGDVAVTLTGTAAQDIQLELSQFLQANGTVRADVSGTGPVAFTVRQLSKAA